MRPFLPFRRLFSLLVLGLAPAFCLAVTFAAPELAVPLPQQSEFSRLAERLAALRSAGGDEDQAAQEKALSMLDAIALPALNAPGEPSPDALNKRLASLVTAQPIEGEDFRVLKLKGGAGAYALVANFSVAGPAAVRIYAGPAGKVALLARIDRYAQKDLFDENLELIPITGPPDAAVSLFVTVGGRADELRSGTFVAWSFDGTLLRVVWSSDLLQQSSYETAADGFRLTYCADPDDAHPGVCRRMTRDRYTWDGTNWKRVERSPAPLPKR
jgi:hypothetical protein